MMLKRCRICEDSGCSLCNGDGTYYDFNEDKKYPQYDYANDAKWQEQMKKTIENTIRMANEMSNKKTTK